MIQRAWILPISMLHHHRLDLASQPYWLTEGRWADAPRLSPLVKLVRALCCVLHIAMILSSLFASNPPETPPFSSRPPSDLERWCGLMLAMPVELGTRDPAISEIPEPCAAPDR
jgi:hypothetical protein